nr:hypothetical protein [Mucilaginibacter sp. FT3.2]
MQNKPGNMAHQKQNTTVPVIQKGFKLILKKKDKNYK